MRIHSLIDRPYDMPILKAAVETKEQAADPQVLDPAKLGKHSETDAVKIKPGHPLCCFCGTYNKKGEADPNRPVDLPEPAGRPRPVLFGLEKYMQNNPVVEKILTGFKDWVSENPKRLYSAKGFEKYLEQHPNIEKHAQGHHGFFVRYIANTPYKHPVEHNPLAEAQAEDVVPSSAESRIRPIVDRIVDRYKNWSEKHGDDSPSLEEFKKYISQFPRLERFSLSQPDYLESLFTS